MQPEKTLKQYKNQSTRTRLASFLRIFVLRFHFGVLYRDPIKAQKKKSTVV